MRELPHVLGIVLAGGEGKRLMPLTADDPMTILGGRIHAGTGGGWMERRPKPTDRHALEKSTVFADRRRNWSR